MRVSRFVIALFLIMSVLGIIPMDFANAATPVKVGKFDHEGRLCVEAGANIDLINAYIPYIGPINTRNNALDVHDCQAAFEAVEEKFKYAYEVAQDSGIDPGEPTNYVHNWSPAKVVIQDFYSEIDGWGAIIYGGATKKHDPYFVNGMTLVEYKESVNERGIRPGYPTGVEHDWNGVRIQDFSGGSWGGGGIIGGNLSPHGAWLVAGNHMEAYWADNGPVTLGNPTSWVYKNSEDKYQQDFERGNITELAGKTWINYNTDEVKLEMPAELPPVGRQEPTAAPPPPVATCSHLQR